MPTLSGFDARVVTAKDAVALEGTELFSDRVPSADFLVMRGWAGLDDKNGFTSLDFLTIKLLETHICTILRNAD